MSQSPESRVQSPKLWAALSALLLVFSAARAEDFTALCADRAAIERVYYNHRLGNKPPFEQTLSPATLEALVKLDLKKEAALNKVYGVAVTPAMLAAEVQRINATTRAPDVLAELKAALDNDTNRFARTVAKPIVVERILRDKFENDDKLHATQRREIEQVRNKLLTAKQAAAQSPKSRGAGRNPKSDNPTDGGQSAIVVSNLVAILKNAASGQFTETTWQLGSRPAEKPGVENPDAVEIRKRFGPNAQILSSPQTEKDGKFYFEDLPGELQNVLRVQLRQAGDVSAVIEMPGGFLLYVCKEKTSETLRVATLSLPKRSYEQWLNEQSENP